MRLRYGFILLFTLLSFGLSSPSFAQGADDAAALVQQGKDYFKAKDYEAAATAFRRAVALAPADFEASYGLGRVLERMQRFEEAAVIYQGMTADLATHPEPLYRLGVVYRKLERHDDAIGAYQSFLLYRATDPDPYFGLGKSYEAKGDSAAAIEAYKKYVELETRPSEQDYVKSAQESIGALEKKLAEAPAAGEEPVTAGVDAVATDTSPVRELKVLEPPNGTATPADAAAALLQGDALFAQADCAAAAAAYAVAATVPSVEASYKLGVARGCAGDFGGAIDAWEATLRLAPGFEKAAANIEQAKRRLAIDTILDAPALAGLAEERRELTRQYVDSGRFVMALRAAEALVSIAPEDPQAYRMIAQTELALANPQAALDAIQQELALMPGDYGLYALAAQAHEQLDQDEQAAYYYEAYLNAVDPDHKDPRNDELRTRLSQLREVAP